MELGLYYIKNYDTITDAEICEFKEKINTILIQRDIHLKNMSVGVSPVTFKLAHRHPHNQHHFFCYNINQVL
jgi:hypothetical protein